MSDADMRVDWRRDVQALSDMVRELRKVKTPDAERLAHVVEGATQRLRAHIRRLEGASQ